MDKIIISYDVGYTNWYVSEFYEYFHQKLVEVSNIKIVYVPLRELAIHFGQEQNNHKSTIFNWYNLILFNPTSEKFFVHSWYDYAPEILEYSVTNNFNLVKFSCVSNLSEEIIQKYESKIEVVPSVYYLEGWSDLKSIDSLKDNKLKTNKCFFNGLSHGYRENILRSLSTNNFFNIKIKTNPEHFQNKQEYFNELSTHKFGLSLNGAANICYRDLELFGLGIVNLRQPLKTKTFNQLIEGIHYCEFLGDDLFKCIIDGIDINKSIDLKIEKLLDESSQGTLKNIIEESINWFNSNCLPENQFKIINSFLHNFEILK